MASAHTVRRSSLADSLCSSQRPFTPYEHVVVSHFASSSKNVHFLKPDYADNTKVNIAGILRKRKRYCESAELTNEWRDVIQGGADRSMAMDFLFHLCESYKIKSWGTSWEYFRQYKQLYASVTGQYMDRNDSKEILKWHDAVLVHRFGLVAPNGGGKDVADSGDLLALQTFNIAYDTGVFSGERHRIQLAGCYLGLAFTGARPAEFVDGGAKERQGWVPRGAVPAETASSP
ncbi:hypothetical protein M406DRAFT_352374 [Cryphonectria parasitica EP155]|uniref:Uncharacterized protein n=1 Tax=Cryphonectria parasitica (strain ATCC 38755 / EP155) TaxID=660469 RepID=A0A9P5CLM4_CRYP1|nr:uncharacterized protein M406DRAFT_352374 [Cryphonectria parasitica EP155]KAF3763489.1 hypothetical protein M406DRAFT_352374 [Cryphonectria parasitica EP155]